MSTTSTRRYASLDILRGLTVMLMIVVNNPGSWTEHFSQLSHAQWNGFTLTDMVFPSFVFCMGAAIWFAYRKSGHSLNPSVLRKLALRSLWIFLAGVGLELFSRVMNCLVWGDSFSDLLPGLRIMGVLQRLALCFFLGSVICLGLKSYGKCLAAALGLSALYWILTLSFGDLTMEGYFGNKIDIALLGERHLYQGEGMPFDPEGLLGTMSALTNVILGFLAAKFVDSPHGENEMRPDAKLAGIGALCAMLALSLSWAVPLNKCLWTPTYALLTSGISMCCFALLVTVFDSGRSVGCNMSLCKAFGCNALFLYCLAWVLSSFLAIPVAGHSLTEWLFGFYDLFLPAKLASLVYSLSLVAVVSIPALILYKKRIFIKL